MLLKKYTLALLSLSLVFAALHADRLSVFKDDPVKASIVKIFTVFEAYSYLEPWNESVKRATGSGCIIEGNRILTNAHVIANQTYLEVQKYGERKHYKAKVLYVSHQADLALLGVEEPSFFEGMRPLPLGRLPYMQQRIAVYGFPTGGNTLSVTTGIVSRIEHRRYTHSGESFLAVQVDAAINPGNSGGPALSEGRIVGVVMQSRSKSQNIGYLVPVPLIRHFLDDVQDGRLDGFAEIGMMTENLESPALKAYYGLAPSQTGQLVLYVTFNSEAAGRIGPGDILTSIDGHRIEDDGTVEFRSGEFTPFKYYLDLHQMGEKVRLGVMRNGEPFEVELTLRHRVDDFLLVDTYRYDRRPTFFIYGGYVFSPLGANLLRASKYKSDLRYFTSKWPTEARQEIVVLLKVLASDVSKGNYGFTLWPVDRINGEIYRDFRDFYTKMVSFRGKYILLQNSDGIQIAIDTQQAKALEKSLLRRYNIRDAESADLNQ